MTIKNPAIFPVILSNGKMSVEIIGVGASVFAINIPTSNGGCENVVLNFPDPSDYLVNESYVGCTIGRVAGRIREGNLPVGNTVYQLDKNEDGMNHLHGGFQGVNKKLFKVISRDETGGSSSVKFYAFSPDMEEGYPGNLKVWVTYRLDKENNLTIRYEAETDRDTHINLTNHSYFNLAGKNCNGLDQELQINAGLILETDDFFIPTGNTLPTAGTPYDFNHICSIKNQYEGLQGVYFNECYILDKAGEFDAVLFDPVSSRRMEVKTSYPTILLYSGDHLNPPFIPQQGICLEAQFASDAPNQSHNSPSLLMAGEKYSQYINLKFSW